jgi:DNA-binding CsgD family transcriptional regulator
MEEFIRNATIEDFKRGYVWDGKKAEFICLICGEYIGENDYCINTHTGRHGNPIERLLMLDKKYTGLTEIQKEFLDMVSNKYSGKEIAMKLACTESTVRNMRFALRERARQARAFLAVMELAEEKMPKITNPKLRVFPVKEEKRKALLPRFADLFEPDRDYAEVEVKKIIKTIYEDDSTIRRYLVDYGYLSRTNDGSKYYKNCEVNIMRDMNKKEIINNYKQQEIEMGIIQIYNTGNGYSYVDICTNLYKPFESIKFQLNLGRIKIKKLQEDWIAYGENAFEFKVVEKLKPNEGSTDKEKVDDLKELLNMWIESQGENLKLYK